MEFMQLLESRRSIRAYKPDTKISEETILELLRAAQLAPSWKNSQTARYYVVMSEEKLKEVRENCLPEFNSNNCANAPALIITAYETKRAGFDREGNPDNELGDKWGVYDLGLQNENILLKAKECGLDTLVMGIRDADKLREVLSVPESQEIVSVISVGYRDIEPPMPKRKAVEDIVRFY